MNITKEMIQKAMQDAILRGRATALDPFAQENDFEWIKAKIEAIILNLKKVCEPKEIETK